MLERWREKGKGKGERERDKQIDRDKRGKGRIQTLIEKREEPKRVEKWKKVCGDTQTHKYTLT